MIKMYVMKKQEITEYVTEWNHSSKSSRGRIGNALVTFTIFKQEVKKKKMTKHVALNS